MKRYNIINNALGWLCFLIAAVTYLLTIEPTASFWDCPEFILQGAKLEVGHPPGNPIFMIAARFFITLFGGSMQTAALAVNSMSALLSAATILLLFWSVTHLIKRLIVSDDATEIEGWKMVLIMGGGICSALAYTWSDTFWFSAVEGEVYAFSSFCTALVVWLMFKWENRADQPHSDRYLILIAYVIGVSIAVHLLNLLCIPALGLIYYYRKFKNVNAKGSLIALGVSCVIVGAILYGLVPGFVQVAQWFELMFVNGFGMSYNMGVLIYAIVLTALFILAIRGLYTKPDSGLTKLLCVLAIAFSGMPFIGHSVLLGLLIIAALFVYVYGFCKKVPARAFALVIISVFVIFIGYSSYALLLIRASANTPMNQNAPDNVFALASYLNREQYGDRPLFNGPVFAETFDEQEYPEGSGNFYVPVDEYGRPRVHTIDGYLRDENGGAFNNPTNSYTKVVKTSPDQPDEYVKEVERPDYKTVSDLNMLFTRIYSNEPTGAHVAGYKSWGAYSTPDINAIPSDVRAKWAKQGFAPKYELMPYLNHLTPVTTHVDSKTGEMVLQTPVWKPGFDVNLRYFVNYQLNHMYWRYFMWNFAGRQNDIQGNGEPHLGNWISGIPVIDNARLGDQSALPDEFGKGNKGHNVFYMLPLLLGLIGLLYQALYNHRTNPMRGIQQFWIVFFLFFMTGIAIVLYLNQTPGQPRERDYAFAGSFYAFAMWIGFGVPAIGIMLRNLLAGKDGKGHREEPSRGVTVATTVLACVVGLAVPLQMVSQTWDDHDRSGRYTTRDFGFNYLASVDPDGVIFTNGDNDTFPLWYAQEVEGFRTDVRVVNLSYLTTDWYANQMQYPTSGADAIPMTVKPQNYAYENLAYSFVVPQNTAAVPAKQALEELYNSDPKRYGAPILSSPKVVMEVDSVAALSRYSTGDPTLDSMFIAPRIGDVSADLSRLGSGLNQSKVLSLDMLVNSIADNWKRPVYFATTVPSSYYLGFTPYLSATGMAYEMTPFRDPEYNVTAEKGYRNVVTNFRWGGLEQPGAEKLYLDETVRRMVSSIRSGIYTIVENLMMMPDVPATVESKKAAVAAGLSEPATRADMARQLLDMMSEKMPRSVVLYDGMLGLYFARTYLDLYMATGNQEDLRKASELATAEADRYAQLVKYATTLDPVTLAQIGRSETYALQYLGEALAIRNRAEILASKPEILSDPQYADTLRFLQNISIENDLRMVPMVFVNGYTRDELANSVESLPESADRNLVYSAIALLQANEQAGVDATAFARELMDKYGFTSSEWNYVID